jgi:hypothetical protein
MARTAVVAGTATAVSGGVERRQHERMQQEADAEAWRQQQQAAAAPPVVPAEPAVAAPSAPATDVVTQLKELAALKDQGILTEQEFAAQKARILAT